MEVSRETIAAVTHGRKQWHTEHVEYAITAAGRAAIAPAKPKAKGTGAEQQQTRTSRSATTRRAKPSTKAGRETT